MNILRYYLNGTLLQTSPEEWGDSLISRVRNTTYHGISEKFTSTFSFVKDGATILRTLFFTHSFEAVCTFEIEQINGITHAWTNIFSGYIDFSKYVDKEFFVKVDVAESSIWETIKAQEKTEFEFNIDDLSPVTIAATFPYIKQRLLMQADATTSSFTGDISIGLYQVENEYKIETLEVFDRFPRNDVDIPGEIEAFVKVLKENKDFQIHITGNIRTRVNSAACTIGVYLFKYDAVTGWDTNWELAIVEDLAPSWTTTDLPIDITINDTTFADVGDAYAIGVVVTSGGGGEALTWIDSIQAEINYLAQVPAKDILAVTPEALFDALLTKMNNGVSIPYYDGLLVELSDYLITSGDAIRGLAGAKIKTNFEDFFSSFDGMFNTGLGIETLSSVKTIVFDRKSRFYGNTEIANIGNVSDCEISVITDNIFSAITVGYNAQTYDDSNGKFEPNQMQDYSFPIKKIANKANRVSKYRADIYGITFTSMNLEGKETTDADSDNDVFVLHTKTTEVVTIIRRDFDVETITGFPDPDNIFNVELTPKRCLLRAASLFDTFLVNIPGTEFIKFQSANKNSGLVANSYEAGPVIYENSDISVENIMGHELFYPFKFAFRQTVSRDFNSILNANMNGYITFSWRGNSYSGYIIEVGVNPQKNSEFTYVLISTAFNNLLTLIH